jgi:hypothetical protein
MNGEQFFIEHCESLFEDMELGGQEVANQLNFNLDVQELVQDGRKELQIFVEKELTINYLMTEEAKKMTPILHTINQALLFIGLMQMMGL